jgi:antitoxin ChpS
MTTATLRNWGGSVALPIPKKILNLISLQSGSAVNIQVERGRLIIEPQKPNFTLAQLMAEHKALNIPRDDSWLDFEALPSEQA